MRPSEMPALRRIDHAYHAPFLTACFAALYAHGYLSELESEQLRIQLKDRHRVQGDESLFQQLLVEKSSAFEVLRARLGLRSFSALLFRWTAAKALESINYSIWSFAQELLGKAELMFNQPFSVFSGSSCTQRVPFSFFLVETANEIHKNADDMHDLVRGLKKWSIGLQGVDSFESTLASHLGFETDEEVGLSDWKLSEISKKSWLQLELLGELNRETLTQLGNNLNLEKEASRLHFLLEDFQGMLVTSKGMSHLELSSFEVMETKRIRMLVALEECKEIASEFQHLLLETIKSSRIPTESRNIWSESEERSILTHLLDKGIPVAEAQSALQSLVRYCQDHKVSPEKLLETELQKIHPSFDNTSSLFLKKASITDRMSEGFNDEKHLIIHKKDRLMQSINHRLLGITVVILLIVNFAPGCGVKTAPRSVVLDPKPEVPYHVEQRASAKKKTELPAVPPKE